MILLAIICTLFALNAKAQTSCTTNDCSRNESCVCASLSSPIATESTPQFVVLTFDDAVTSLIYNQYLGELLENRKNADGSDVSATFFVPHEFSEYNVVNFLYNAGFEIAVNSISKTVEEEYWANATEALLIEEFGGQRQLIAHFANISINDIKGARTPFLQLAGDTSFSAYSKSGIEYDNSWPTRPNQKYYPYTLDFLSPQECVIGECPVSSYPGLWVAPILNLQGTDGVECNTLLGCHVNGTAQDVFHWLQGEFNKTYHGNRAPLPLLINSAWFLFTDSSFEGLLSFLNYLETLDGVYLASMRQVIDWMKDPVPLGDFELQTTKRNQMCTERVCALSVSETELRFMRSCVSCSAVYPWLGNPLGEPKKSSKVDQE